MMGNSVDPEETEPTESAKNELPEDSLDNPFDPFANEDMDEIPDWLQMDLDSPTTDEDLPDWLQPPDSNPDELPEWLRTPTATNPQELSLEDEEVSETVSKESDTQPELLNEEEKPETDATPSVDDSLKWLDQVASGDIDATQELVGDHPTLQWPDSSPPVYMEGDVEDTVIIPPRSDDEEVLPIKLEEMPDADAVLDELTLPDLELGQAANDTDLESDEAENWPPDVMGDTSELLPDITLEEGDVDQDSPLINVPEDPEDQMAWLEQLAARQGAPVEELPTLLDDDIPSVEDLSGTAPIGEDVSDDLTSEIPAGIPADEFGDLTEEMPDDLVESTAWLDQLTVQEEDTPIEETSEDETGVEIETMADEPQDELQAVQPFAGEDGDALEVEEEPEYEPIAGTTPPENEEEAMAWLEQLAARQGAPLEELPTVDEAAEIVAEPSAEEETPPEPVDAPIEAALDDDEDDTLQSEPAEEGLPEDPVEAMAWLEDLVATRQLSEESLPVISDELSDEAPAEAEADMEMTLPDDPDEQIAWLEQLAARQGAPLEELPTVDALPENEAEEITDDAEQLTELSPPPEADIDTLIAAAETPSEDEEEAMEWLEEFAARREEIPEEMPATADLTVDMDETPQSEILDSSDFEEETEADNALAWLDELAPESAATAPLAEEPAGYPDLDLDDPDAAMAWLEKLALTDEEDEIEAVAAQPPSSESIVDAEGEEDEIEAIAIQPPSSESIIDAEDKEMVEEIAEEPIDEPPQIVQEDDSLVTTLSGQAVDDEMPDWLGWDDEESTDNGESWLDSLDSNTGWLEAEEAEQESQADLAVPETMQTQPAETADADEADDTPLERLLVTDEMLIDAGKLRQARQALDDNDYQSAITLYGDLVESGEELDLLVTDLRMASLQFARQPLLHRILGDAYAKQGELQKALDVYRQALDRL